MSENPITQAAKFVSSLPEAAGNTLRSVPAPIRNWAVASAVVGTAFGLISAGLGHGDMGIVRDATLGAGLTTAVSMTVGYKCERRAGIW